MRQRIFQPRECETSCCVYLMNARRFPPCIINPFAKDMS